MHFEFYLCIVESTVRAFIATVTFRDGRSSREFVYVLNQLFLHEFGFDNCVCLCSNGGSISHCAFTSQSVSSIVIRRFV